MLRTISGVFILCCAMGAAFAGAPAAKASLRVEERGGQRQDVIKTWQLRGGTRISTTRELLRGEQVGHSRTVERVNGSQHTRGVLAGVRFSRSSGFLGGAQLTLHEQADGYGFIMAPTRYRPNQARLITPSMRPKANL